MADVVDASVQALRVAIATADGATALRVLARGDWDAPLQLAGEGVLTALEQGCAGASDWAQRSAAVLRERDWVGDAELADQIEALLGDASLAGLAPLTVDLEEVAGILEGDPTHCGGRIDLVTGEVWPVFAFEDAGAQEDDPPERWLFVDGEGSRDGYRDMTEFLSTITDPGHVDRLEAALSGHGAFRRFKDVLAEWHGELDRWYVFADERQRGRARAWLAAVGYAARPVAIANRGT